MPSRLTAADGRTLPPAVGRFLVARARLPDPNFFETVVLLLDYDEVAGAVGVVINRRTELAVGEATTHSAPLADRADPLYLGGPVALETLTVLLAGDDPPASASPVLPGLSVIRDDVALEELLRGDPPAPAMRFYAGYAGWAGGQLEDEIARGVWNLLPGDSRWVFSDHPGDTWERLVRILFGPTT